MYYIFASKTLIMMNFSVNTHHAYLNSNVVISNNTKEPIFVKDSLSSEEWQIVDKTSIRLSAGKHILSCGETNVTITIEDAVKFGGSRIREAFVFDNNPWIFVTAKDRFYAAHMDTGEEKLEHLATPDSIEALGFYNSKPCECFLFRTKMDYSIYNVETGKILKTFSNHIYSNSHIVIYRSERNIVVYDYRFEKTLVEFNGQYSLGSKFYFIKEGKLHSLNLSSSYINTIDEVGEVTEDAFLYDNYLIKLSPELSHSFKYKLFSLGNGENNIKLTEFIFPYYLESWEGHSFGIKDKLKKEFDDFAKSIGKNSNYPNIIHNYTVINVSHACLKWEKQRHHIKLVGEVISYPSNLIMPFTLSGEEGGSINFRLHVVEIYHSEDVIEKNCDCRTEDYELPKGEKCLGRSTSGSLVVSLAENHIICRNIKTDQKNNILEGLFDTTYYIDAYFTSDGKSAIFENQDKEFNILGFENLSFDKYDIEGMSVPRRAGFNGYKPEILFLDSRKPVWRDPISLVKVKPEDLSNHIFMSPDGKFSAHNNFRLVINNRITGEDISNEEYFSLCKEYNFNWKDSDDDKAVKISKRTKLLNEYGKDILFKYIIEEFTQIVMQSSNIPANKKTERILDAVNKTINDYINKKEEFTPLFLDKLGYVIYQDNETMAETRILIGRSVYFLNYVSFSYDSCYLAFGAKMRSDEFRLSEDGVFVLYDLKDNKEIIRKDHGNNLCAVWMTMFNKTGDVAYYDSTADAYIATKESDFKTIEKVSGKSLLCFSPSGNYIAFSDQKYIDYTHHPHANWGHQPSGNIFIHSMNDIMTCLSQFNDFGEGISGVACRAGNVASAAFSSDEKRLMAVGDDGVVVVRNLNLEVDDIDNVYPQFDYNDKRCRWAHISRITVDGIIEDYEPIYCSEDEMWDPKEDVIYSFDGKVLKNCMNIKIRKYDVLPGAETILNDAFHGVFMPGEGDWCYLEEITLPSSMKSLSSDVFKECPNLKAIYVPENQGAKFEEMLPDYKDIIWEDVSDVKI
jgi:hypothetical protein